MTCTVHSAHMLCWCWYGYVALFVRCPMLAAVPWPYSSSLWYFVLSVLDCSYNDIFVSGLYQLGSCYATVLWAHCALYRHVYSIYRTVWWTVDVCRAHSSASVCCFFFINTNITANSEYTMLVSVDSFGALILLVRALGWRPACKKISLQLNKRDQA